MTANKSLIGLFYLIMFFVCIEKTINIHADHNFEIFCGYLGFDKKKLNYLNVLP